MSIERRWKLSVAGMAKRSFRRVSEGHDGRSERLARWHGQRPDASPTTPSRICPPASAGGFLWCGRPRWLGPWMANLFGTNSAALILQRCCRFSFSLSRWERAGVRVLSSKVPLRKAPSPGLRPASPKGRGKIDSARSVGHMPCRTPLPWMAPAPPIDDTEQDARTAGSVKPRLSPQPARLTGAMDGPSTTNRRHRAGCEDRRLGETSAFTAAGQGGGGHGWPRRRKTKTPETDAPPRPCRPTSRRRSACPAWR